MADCHFRSKLQPKLRLQRARVGVARLRRLGAVARRLAGAFAEALDIAHAQAARDDAVGDCVGIGDGKQRATMAGGNRTGGDQRATMFGQRHQAQRVGDMAATLADDAGDVGVGVAVVGAELRIALRFFERVEIGALHVLDDRQFERFAIADFDDDDWNLMQAGALRGAPAPLAGDDLEGVFSVRRGPHDHRLNDAALFDRSGEFVEFVVAKTLARIIRIGAQEFDRRLARAGAPASRRFLARFAEQRGEAAAEARAVIGVTGGLVGHRLLLQGERARQAARQRPSR